MEIKEQTKATIRVLPDEEFRSPVVPRHLHVVRPADGNGGAVGESVLTAGTAGQRGGGAETARLFEDAGLEFRESSLHFGGVSLSAIADGVGTPAYVYSADVIRRQFRALDEALSPVPHRIAYAVKANANLAVLRILRDLGAGADIVSGGELARALAAGFDPDRIVFSGVGKTDGELTAAVEAGIGHVHLESTAELAALGRIAARLGKSVRVGIRVNPDVTADTHPYIATGQGGIKFGVPVDQVVPLALAVVQHPLLTLDTIAMHIGSQLLDARPLRRGNRAACSIWWRSCARQGSRRSARWTSAAASASAIATSSH